jgi:N-formylglutamate amidohydrolase
VVPPPYLLHAPDEQTAAVVFASAHSGRSYSAEFLALARLDPLTLRRSEDSFVEALFGAAPAAGAPLIAATFPRAWCDANREAWELDPSMFVDSLPHWVNTSSLRVQAGLGTIARVVASGEAIYRDRLTFADAQGRVSACWEPWHEALQDLLAQTRRRFGASLLIDCHSMPSRQEGRGDRPLADFVIGDAFATSCAPEVTRLIESSLRGMGYRVARNDPYAGGYMTRAYGKPRERSHAVQIEVARALYMDERRMEKSAGFERLRRDMTTLIEEVVGLRLP